MTTEPRTPDPLEPALSGCWVVVILGPDPGDTSEWAVRADEIGEAVTEAVARWTVWAGDPDDPEPDEVEHEPPKPHILRVYRNSWLTEYAWAEYDAEGIGSYDMSKLANFG